MTNLDLDARTGILIFGQYSLDFSSQNAAVRTALAAGMQAVVRNKSWGAQVVAEVRFMNEEFTLSCDFLRPGVTDSGVVMYWRGGRAAKQGWDATQGDLIADRDDLASAFKAYSGVNMEDISDTVKLFRFAWGHVLVGCSLQATVVSLSIDWFSSQGQGVGRLVRES